MQSRERRLKAADGTEIFVTDWRPETSNAAGGSIVLMHGLGEHSGRYQHVAQFFSDAGMTVRTYDYRGHGRSEGVRGDVPDQQCLLRDAEIVIKDFAEQSASPPILLGHSMGGLIAARYAVERRSPLRGLILSSPVLALPLSTGQKILLKILSAVAPGLTVPNGLEKRFLSHDAAVVDAYKEDPLVHARISARLLNGMLTAIEIAQAGASTLNLPTLLVLAGDDHIVDSSGSDTFYQALPSGSSTRHVYPTLYHEIFNEIGAESVFTDLRTWLQNQNLI